MSVEPHLQDAPAGVAEIALAAHEADDLEGLARPLMQVLARTTGLETIYLTMHDRVDDTQLWRFVLNTGAIELPEGGEFPWAETLCYRMDETGTRQLHDVAEVYPDHPAVTVAGIRGYVSVPYQLVGRGEEIAGTLCGASSQPIDLDATGVATFELFARIIADRLGREIDLGRERIRAERAERRLVERTRFVAAAQHALKTPLTIVAGWSETLDERYDQLAETDRRSAVTRIRGGATRLRSQLDDLLDEARATILGGDLNPVPLDVAASLEALAQEHDGASELHHVENTGGAGVVVMDPRVLDQIMGHLIENAVKYSPDGGTVRLGARLIDDEVVILVDDEGIGIPEDRDVFEPFQRGDGTSTRGAGLGLHIVRTLVTIAEGTVRAERRDEGGSRFELRFPAA